MQPLFRLALLLGLSFILVAQHHPPQEPTTDKEEKVRLPNGKLQDDEILKADHQKDLKEAARLLELAQLLNAELEKNDQNVLSLSCIKDTEEIEKLAKRIRSRIRR